MLFEQYHVSTFFCCSPCSLLRICIRTNWAQVAKFRMPSFSFENLVFMKIKKVGPVRSFPLQSAVGPSAAGASVVFEHDRSDPPRWEDALKPGTNCLWTSRWPLACGLFLCARHSLVRAHRLSERIGGVPAAGCAAGSAARGAWAGLLELSSM